MKKKILLISTTSVDHNGITKIIYQYLSAMNRTDINFTLLSSVKSDTKIIDEFKSLGINIKKIEFRNMKPLKYFIELRQYIANENFDIVHVHGNSATMFIEMLAAFLGQCKVRIAHSHNTTCTHIRVHKVLKPFFDILCTRRFACGYYAGKWLFGNKKFDIIPNGRNLKRFVYNEIDRNEIRAKYNIENYFVLGHVGRFNNQKNHEFIIDTFSEVKKRKKNAKLILIGNGEKFEYIKTKVQKLNLENDIIFTGNIENVDKLLSAMDIMMLPSLYEGLPLVVLEWQASGLPSLLSDCVSDECAITNLVKFKALDDGAESWASDILNMNINDRKKSSKYAISELKKAGYDINDAAEKLRNLYFNL